MPVYLITKASRSIDIEEIISKYVKEILTLDINYEIERVLSDIIISFDPVAACLVSVYVNQM